MRMQKISKKFSGASIVEYALLVSLIAITGISAVHHLGQRVEHVMLCTAGVFDGGGTERGGPEDTIIPCTSGDSNPEE